MLATILALAACSEHPAPNDATPVRSVDGYPREVVLADGGTLLIEARPRRVLPANSSALDFLSELVPPEHFVAIPTEADSYACSVDDPAPWAGIPRMSRYTGEDILAYRPDLVVAHSWQDQSALRVVRNSGVAVITVPQYEGFDSLRSTLRLFGEVFDETERAEAVVADIERRREGLQANERRKELRAMVYTNYGSGGWSAGTNTSAHTIIEMTGMRNAAAEAGLVSHSRVDIERLLTLDPDVLVLSGPERAQEMNASESYVRNEPALRSLRALREERLVVLPASLYGTNSHYLVDAAEELARQVDALYESE